MHTHRCQSVDLPGNIVANRGRGMSGRYSISLVRCHTVETSDDCGFLKFLVTLHVMDQS